MDLVVAILPHAQEADSDELVDAVVARGEGPPKPGCLDDAVLLLGSGVGETAQPGESGPGARAMQAAWARSVRDQCLRARVPFFFKQWGGVHKKRAGRALDGRTWDEMPDVHGVDRGDNAGVDGRRERDELAAAMNTAEHVAAREGGLRSADAGRPG